MTDPGWLVRNFMPSWTAAVSGSAATAGVAVAGKTVHGQPARRGGGEGPADRGHGVAGGSLAPDTFTVYVVDAVSAALGLKVAVRDGAS